MGDPTSDRIAIVGMGGVFPGAPTLDALWRNVCGGVDAITDVPPGRWDPVFHDPTAKPGRVDRFYCRRGGFVDDVASFDPTAFGIMPIVVDGGEPDQFLALAQAAAALDDAGGVHERVAPDRIGVVVGRGGYRTAGVARLDQRIHTVEQLVEGLRALLPDLDPSLLDQVRDEFVRRLGPDRPEASIGLVPNLAASRIANRLDFQGPAYTVDAACASTLVAVDHGLHELVRGRCDLVVAGGSHHCHDVTLWSVFSQLEALSRSGGIRPFSRRADGILIGEGTGFFVLKRLGDAERDGDRVYAVVCGSGIASDGRSSSLMSPNPSGQIMAIERAWQAAGLEPTTVGLIEAHGTGTPAGDQAELESLRKVFGSADFDQPRAGLGSIKSMIGHAMPAAGAAGLAKAALALHHRVLPPTLHADDPHPLIDETRFRLVTEAEPWEVSGRAARRAGVNAFGFGGINAHLVLEEHPGSGGGQLAMTSCPPPERTPRSRASTAPSNVAASRRKAGGHSGENGGPGLGSGDAVPGPGGAGGAVRAGVAVGAAARPTAGRVAAGGLPATLLLPGADAADLGRRLEDWVAARDAAAAPEITDVPAQAGPARLAIVGVDARRLELARKVVARGEPWRGRNGVWFEPRGLLLDGGKVAFLFPGVEPTFEPRVDDVAAHFGLAALGTTLDDDRRSSRSPLERQSRGILAVGRLLDTALGRLGIGPDMVAGHSLGEWSGEVAAGVIADDDFADLVERLRPGAIKVADVVFLALGCGADTATELVAGLDGTVVSHDNCTHQSVVCGPPDEISVVADRCRARHVLAQELPFRSGFHSPLFAAHVPTLRAALGDLPLHVPRLPLWSATTCRPYPDDVDGVRDLALRHLVEPVRFRELTLALHEAGARVFVQVGVGNLTGFVDDTLRDREAVTVAANSAKRSGLEQLCHVAAALWVEGRDVAFAPLASPPGEIARTGRASAAARPVRALPLDLGTRLIRDLTPLDLSPPTAQTTTAPTDAMSQATTPITAERTAASHGAPHDPGTAAALTSPAARQSPQHKATATPSPTGDTPATHDPGTAAATTNPPAGPGGQHDAATKANPPASPAAAPAPAPLGEQGEAATTASLTTDTATARTPTIGHRDERTTTANLTTGTTTVGPQAPARPDDPREAGRAARLAAGTATAGTQAPAPLDHRGEVGRATNLGAGTQAPGPLGERGEAATAARRPAGAAGGGVAAPSRVGERGEAAVAMTADGMVGGADGGVGVVAPRGVGGLVATRRLGLEEVPAWADHAFFRQRDGWPYGDDRFPLVPMTGIIEMLQEHANRLHPELVPVAVVDIAAFRWLTVDPPVEVTLRASSVPAADGDPAGSVRVKAVVDGHARATVVLAPRYPARTPANAERLVNERPSHVEAQRFYIDRHMFHGPAYQGVRAFQAVGDNGSRAVLKSLAAPGALLDNAGQLMGHWLSAHADVDRLVLPTSIERVELYGPHPPPGTLVDCTVTITHLDAKSLRADMLLTVDRRLWCRVTGWEDRRFATDALVFETLQWPEKAGMSVEAEHGAYTLIDERWPDSATRDVVMRRYLGRPERTEYDGHHPLGQRAFLLGRIAVKDAVRRWLWAKRRGPLFPAEIVVANEAGGRPLVRGPFTDDLRVSLAHVEGRAVAIVAEGVDVGIDVERVEPRRPTFESLVLTAGEQRLTPPEGYGRDAWLTALWAVKEAAAKATGRGLRGRPKDVEVAERQGTTVRVGDRWIAFERLPGAAPSSPSSPSSAAQKEHIVAWTVTDR